MTKVVIVCTSATHLKGHPTGLWLEELATPYYAFQEAGFEVVVASPKGGPVPIDKNSIAGDFFTEAAKKFMHDADAYSLCSHSIALDTIKKDDMDALYLAGGHGTCVDFIDNTVLKDLIESMYNDPAKVVAADCHGPIALAECVKSDGSPLVKDLTVTGFTDSEEDAVQLTSVVPFLVESRFVEQGAKFVKADDWHPKAVVDGKLVTGQNPQSSDACAAEVVKLLK
mmetsp:Transcript_29389/g.43149  ORF Transcript_29389/g.43149 Transcript_29389/m.43149 type:complete len:226 (-) Transcript_29389:21-698(-)|eukprot:CAMPEP_0116024010 /NCGR_PEP_ID=MMETSP0321-20121206/12026_1 /TAXON_ID=163516 /ORGANISM="Leptocylindrus danicus var. danicus, Strain B650" /LENGTH=225 /DNA_ID=CAMNT_0003495587 /DNA_START=38 /DNA_END=715 /DNA_ORIENTATION=-